MVYVCVCGVCVPARPLCELNKLQLLWGWMDNHTRLYKVIYINILHATFMHTNTTQHTCTLILIFYCMNTLKHLY